MPKALYHEQADEMVQLVLNRFRSYFIGIVRISVALPLMTGMMTGCAQVNQLQDAMGLSGGGSLAIDPNDACHAERSQFAESKSYFTKEILGSTLIGAAGGMALGGATAALTKGNVGWGLLGGAVAGGTAGFAAGYYQTMAARYQDQQELAQKMNADLHTEGDQIDHTLATFGRLRVCRLAQATSIKTQLRHGQIDRATAESLLAYQHARFDEEVALAKSYGATMATRDQEFQSATAQLHTSNGGAGNKAVVAATETIPEKRSNYEKAVDKAAAASTVAFNLDGDTKSGWRWPDGISYG